MQVKPFGSVSIILDVHGAVARQAVGRCKAPDTSALIAEKTTLSHDPEGAAWFFHQVLHPAVETTDGFARETAVVEAKQSVSRATYPQTSRKVGRQRIDDLIPQD